MGFLENVRPARVGNQGVCSLPGKIKFPLSAAVLKQRLFLRRRRLGGKSFACLAQFCFHFPHFPSRFSAAAGGAKMVKLSSFWRGSVRENRCRTSETRFRERLFSLLLLHLSETQEKLRKIYSVSPKENVGDVKYLLHCRLLFLCSNCLDGLFPKNMAVCKDCC